jgi:la-related protein 4
MDSGLKAHQHVEDKKDSDGDQDRDSGDQLKRAVQKQIEYYFSRENLITDTYLMSQMDGDQYVPVAVIAGFNQVRRLTADLEVIMEAIKISDALQLDETGHKVKAHSKRCVLLVRGIPQNTEEETVKGLFQRKDECPECTNCEVAHNDSWYIGFDTEEDALKAYRYLREVVIEFNGHPLHVRVKEKVFQRSKQTVPQHFPPVGFGRGMGFQPAGAGPFYQPPPVCDMCATGCCVNCDVCHWLLCEL